MPKTRKSVIFSVLANFASIGTSLILVAIVARWLSPAEIGAFAIAYAVFNLLEPLRQSQMIAFIIQAEQVDHGLMRGVNFVGWTNTVVVLMITAAIILVLYGPLDLPSTGNMLLIMSLGFILSTLVQPAHAMLSRKMRFGVITSVEIVGGVIKAVVTVIGLFVGLREEALAWGIVAELAAKLVFLIKVERGEAIALPGWANTRPIWDFCLRFTGAQFLNRSSVAATDIVIGSFLGLAATGFHNRATVLVRTMRSGIEGAVMPVAMSAFALSNREDQSLPRQNYLTAVSLLTGLTWSALAVFIAVAEPFVMTIYGPRWEATIPLAQVVSAAAIVHAATAMAPALLASVGRVNTLFQRNMMMVVPRLLILFVTAQFNLMAVVWGGFASMAISFVINQSLLKREFDISVKDLALALWRSAVVATLSALAAFLLLTVPAVGDQTYLVQLLLSLSIAGIVWLTMLFLVRHHLAHELLGIFRKLLMVATSRA